MAIIPCITDGPICLSVSCSISPSYCGGESEILELLLLVAAAHSQLGRDVSGAIHRFPAKDCCVAACLELKSPYFSS